MKSGSYDFLKLSRLALTCKSNKYNEAGTGDLGVLTTNETSPMKMAAEMRWILLIMPAQTVATSRQTNEPGADWGMQNNGTKINRLTVAFHFLLETQSWHSKADVHCNNGANDHVIIDTDPN